MQQPSVSQAGATPSAADANALIRIDRLEKKYRTRDGGITHALALNALHLAAAVWQGPGGGNAKA